MLLDVIFWCSEAIFLHGSELSEAIFLHGSELKIFEQESQVSLFQLKPLMSGTDC